MITLVVVRSAPSGPPTSGYCQQKTAQFGWTTPIVVYDKDGNFSQLNGGGNFHLVADGSMEITWKQGYPPFPIAVTNALDALLPWSPVP